MSHASLIEVLVSGNIISGLASKKNMFCDLIIAVVLVTTPALSAVIKNQPQRCRNSSMALEELFNRGKRQTSCLNSSIALEGTFTRGKRQTGCLRTQWTCRDGTCIPFYGKCDGVVDCADKSDETFGLCRNSVCQENLFRCTYGACVDGTAPCNGEQDCADNSDELLTSCTNDTRIEKDQFRCDNGQKIPVIGMCDGERDCKDGSDETIQACAGNTCVSYLTRCAYGACVDDGSICNGKTECADGSDESDDLCNRMSTPPVRYPWHEYITSHRGGAGDPIYRFYDQLIDETSFSSDACVLPTYPANGQYKITKLPTAKPGDRFKDAVFITVSCNSGYDVDGTSSVIVPCIKQMDLSTFIPTCKRYCKLTPHHSVEYNCRTTNNGTTIAKVCGLKEFVGTTAIPKCKPNYRGSPSHMHCTENDWNYVAKCAPDCGRITPVGQENAIGGVRAKHGEIPWHAGIYDKRFIPYQQICGGSLVAITVVITAAHCFWSDTEGKQLATNYAVAVGKIFRPWADTHDVDAQFSDIIEIYIPDQFHGISTNFQNDIALVVLEKEIQYKPFIRPVCVSFDYSLNKNQLYEGNLGKIAGWGLTAANGKAASVLQVLELPFVTYSKCYDESPDDFKEYITSDKICAGYKNGTALCQGDSGGGLAFLGTDGGIQRYYLRGIVSTAPRNNQKCDPFQRTTFTELLKHEHFINDRVIIEGI